eukprot:Skav228045  [mRNA]  locus=scaffold1188:184746:187223:+ [translate_table: standard]
MASPDLQRHGRVLAEAVTFFKGRAAKSGIALIFTWQATASLDALRALGARTEADLLTASDDALKMAQDMLSECDSKEQQICWKNLISILNLMRENHQRALRIIKDAVTLARTLPFSERKKLLVMVLRTQQVIQLLSGESAVEMTKEVEAESNSADSPNGPFLDFLRFLLQHPQNDHLKGYLCFIDFLAFKLRSCLNEAKRVANDVEGIRTPFHSTLWGFSRTANIENPTKEFRVLDLDAGRWKEDLPFICRYLMGAQSTRPTEAILRNGGLLVSRLVSARMKLQPPLKIDG